MNNNNFFCLLMSCATTVTLAGCSSNPAIESDSQAPTNAHSEVIQSHDNASKNNNASKNDIQLADIKLLLKVTDSQNKTTVEKNVPVIMQNQPAQKKAVPLPAKQPVNWVPGRMYGLTGDFAYQPEAQRFIQQMVRKHGFDGNYLNMLFSQAKDTGLRVKPLTRSSSSSDRSWTRYRSFFITPRHINGGVAFWKRYEKELQRAQQQYGVPPEYIVGILGVETIYGGNVGKHRAIDALATKAFHQSRRTDFFQNELEKYLLMSRREGLNPLNLMGSSAGALGLCQFMPSNIKTLAVDYNRNGECNVWDPVDAIGSVANYFQKHGWKKGGAVAVPALTEGNAYRSLPWGYDETYSLSRLAKNGVIPTGNIDSTARLIKLETNAGDEVWLGGHNFYVITRYNHSSKYAMAVHQLAQEVKGRYLGSRTVASRTSVLR